MAIVYLDFLQGYSIGPVPKDFCVYWPRTTEKVGQKMRQLLWEIHHLPSFKFDFLAATTGRERIGKTSLDCHLAELLDPSFGLERIAFKGYPFIDIGKTLKPGNARLWDEGPNAKDALTQETKDTDEHLFKCGQLYAFNFVVKPNLRWLGAVIREHRAAIWILVTARGKALVHLFHRADYPGAKPSWVKLFGFDYPDYVAEWLPEYNQRKFADLYEVTPLGERVLPTARWERLVPGFRRALANHRARLLR